MDLDEFEIKNPKCFLATVAIGLVVEVSVFIFYL